MSIASTPRGRSGHGGGGAVSAGGRSSGLALRASMVHERQGFCRGLIAGLSRAVLCRVVAGLFISGESYAGRFVRGAPAPAPA